MSDLNESYRPRGAHRAELPVGMIYETLDLHGPFAALQGESSQPAMIHDEDIVDVIELRDRPRERLSSPGRPTARASFSLRRIFGVLGAIASLILTGWLLIVLTMGVPSSPRQLELHSISTIIQPMIVLEPIEIDLGSSSQESESQGSLR